MHHSQGARHCLPGEAWDEHTYKDNWEASVQQKDFPAGDDAQRCTQQDGLDILGG